MRLNQIREQVGRGEYDVDTKAVADAVLRRLFAPQLTAAGPEASQDECS